MDLYGARPFLSATHRIDERWDFNLFYAETVQTFNQTQNGELYTGRDLQSYWQPGLIYRSSPALNWTLGYVYQRNNPFSFDNTYENRLWQQVLYSQDLGEGKRLSHRLRLEERWIEEKTHSAHFPFSTRVRYQLAYVSPFQGPEIVTHSWFYSVYNEFYFSTSGNRNAFFSENWTYAGIGYQTSNWGRLEVGPLLIWSVINTRGDHRHLWLLQVGSSFNF